METIDGSSISSHVRKLACTSRKQRKKRCNTGKPKCDMCRNLGVQCIYPRFSFKPGPKKKQAMAARSPIEAPAIPDSSDSTIQEYEHFQPSLGDGHFAYDCLTPNQTTMDATGTQPNFGTSGLQIEPELFNTPAVLDGSLFMAGVSSIPSDTIASNPESLWATLLLDQNNPFSAVSPTTYPTSSGLPSREIIDHLVDIFFAVVHPQFRLLHRPTIIQQLNDHSYICSEKAALLLNAIFALAARYSDDIRVEILDLSLQRPLGDKPSLSKSPLLNSPYQRRERWELGMGFLLRANKLLQEETSEADKIEHKTGETQEPSIQVLQAAALLAFAEVGMGTSNRAQSMISMCARMAYDLGLDSVDCDDYESQAEPSLNKQSWIRKEELRRLWWRIWDLDNFTCTAKYRPRTMSPIKCKTKLPVNDVDWFDGNEVPSFFLPSNIRRLPEFMQSHPLSSAAVYRIISCHLIATLANISDNEDPDEPSDLYSVLEVCAVVWKESLPTEFDYSYKMHIQQPHEHSEIFSDLFPMHIYCELIKLLLGTERMFKGITPAAISTYCHQYANRSIRGMNINPEASSPAAQAFFSALSASNAICSIVRDWPSNYIIHTSPLVGGSVLIAAFIQLLVKIFAGGASDMAEKASLSLRLLVMAVEQLAEYWGLCRTKLSSFRAYEQNLYAITEESDEIYSETAITPFRAFLHSCSRGWRRATSSSQNHHYNNMPVLRDLQLELLSDGSALQDSMGIENFGVGDFFV